MHVCKYVCMYVFMYVCDALFSLSLLLSLSLCTSFPLSARLYVYLYEHNAGKLCQSVCRDICVFVSVVYSLRSLCLFIAYFIGLHCIKGQHAAFSHSLYLSRCPCQFLGLCMYLCLSTCVPVFVHVRFLSGWPLCLTLIFSHHFSASDSS